MSHVILKGLKKSFGVNHDATKAINGLDLSIYAGEFFVLLGPSGCGKTTTLRCIAGLERPDAGSVSIGEHTVAYPERGVFVPPERRDIGMVFQNYALWPHYDVLNNVAYPAKARKNLGTAEAEKLARQALVQVGLAREERRFPAELSGGQQQRVALARALVAAPQVVLFDEPLSNLDAQLRVTLRHELRRVQRETGHTAVYVTHDQTEAMALADRIAVMRAGLLEQLGTPQEIYQRPASAFVARFVGFDNCLPARVVHSGNTLELDAGLGIPMHTPILPGYTGGDRVVVAVRANHVCASPQAHAGSLYLADAILVDVHYLGDRYEAWINCKGVLLRASVHPEHWPIPAASLIGHRGVHISFTPEKVLALPPDPLK